MHQANLFLKEQVLMHFLLTNIEKSIGLFGLLTLLAALSG